NARSQPITLSPNDLTIPEPFSNKPSLLQDINASHASAVTVAYMISASTSVSGLPTQASRLSSVTAAPAMANIKTLYPQHALFLTKRSLGLGNYSVPCRMLILVVAQSNPRPWQAWPMTKSFSAFRAPKALLN